MYGFSIIVFSILATSSVQGVIQFDDPVKITIIKFIATSPSCDFTGDLLPTDGTYQDIVCTQAGGAWSKGAKVIMDNSTGRMYNVLVCTTQSDKNILLEKTGEYRYRPITYDKVFTDKSPSSSDEETNDC